MDMDSHRIGVRKMRFMVFALIFTTFAVTKTKQQDSFYFDPSPINQNVVDGFEALLRCDVSNRRQIMFYWTLNGRQLANTSRRHQIDSDLYITRVDRTQDGGSFRCIATNVTTGIALRSTEARLNISWINSSASVELRQPPEDQLRPGAELSLRCHVEGHPEPSVEWYRNTIRLFGSQRVRFAKSHGGIRIVGVTASDNGVYSCRAVNPAGQLDSTDNFILNIPGDDDTPRLRAATFTQVLVTKLGGVAQFDCQYDNAALTEWNRDERRLISDDKYSVLDNGTLIVRQVTPRDAGVYRCDGLSDGGSAQTFAAQLTIASLNSLTEASFEPKPSTPEVVPVGGRLEIRCLVPKGVPTPVHRWDGPYGQPVLGQGRVRADDGLLIIGNADVLDTGNYSCSASNLAGTTSRTVSIVVSVAPKLSRPPLSERVTEGESVEFDCRVIGTPFPVTTVSWTKSEQPLHPVAGQYEVNPAAGTLRIVNVAREDEGNYACVVNTTGHPVVVSGNAHLYVEKRLQFLRMRVNENLELSSNATVSCRAEGRVAPRLRWSRLDDDSRFGELPDDVYADDDGNLHFVQVRSTHAGRYQCIASSDQGTINFTVSVEVVMKPKFKVRPANTTAYEGYSTMLHCVAVGDPTPVVRWDKNNRVSSFDPRRFKLLSNGSLYISEVYMEDDGKYSCTVGNSGGLDQEDAYLHVAPADSYSRLHGKTPADNDMLKTIVIAVCCAVAYLAIVIGLAVYCGIRMMRAKNLRKVNHPVQLSAAGAEKVENGAIPLETTGLVEKPKDKLHVKSEQDAFSMSGAGSSSHNSQSTNSRTSQRAYDKLAFPRQELQSLGMLGKGFYGDVFLSKAFGIRSGEAETLVLVKSLLSHHDVYQAEFYREVDVFSRVNHEHVVRLLGVCREIEPLFLITEYCEWGDLKQFLLVMRKDGGITRSPSVRLPPLSVVQKLTLCSQIAVGLHHLTGDLRLVHRDVAARNVLLAPSLDVKLGSPSLCRDVYAAEYVPLRQRFIAVRWAAPELLTAATVDVDLAAPDTVDRAFSTATDVFAFGVYVWEVFALGDLPLRRLSDDDVVRERQLGTVAAKLVAPAGCPPDLWRLVDRCFADCAADRPSFADMAAAFDAMLANLVV